MGKITLRILIAQLSLALFLAVCILLIPRYLFSSNEGGVSNYGTVTKTIIPFSLGFGLCSVFTILAAVITPKHSEFGKLRVATVILGYSYLIELLSTYPYKLNRTWDDIHILISIIISSYILVYGGWLAIRLLQDKLNLSLFAVQLVGFFLSALTLFGFIHILMIAEILMILGFGALLARTVGIVAK